MTYIKNATVILFAVSLCSCFLFQSSQPGESLGYVEVEAHLVVDTCGPGTVSAGSTLSYEVEIQRSGSEFRWLGPEGSATGSFVSDEEFCIELVNQWPVRDPDLWLEDPGCEMHQLERLCGTLTFDETDEESETPVIQSLTARHESFVSAIPGSWCDDQIGISTGMFLTLPCQTAYELVGVAVVQ